MNEKPYDKIKNGLTRLSYLLNQTTRPELAVTIVDALRFYQKDNPTFLQQSLEALEIICGYKNILPKQTYLLALATLEQVKYRMQ